MIWWIHLLWNPWFSCSFGVRIFQVMKMEKKCREKGIIESAQSPQWVQIPGYLYLVFIYDFKLSIAESVSNSLFFHNYLCYVKDVSRIKLLRYFCGTSIPATSKISHEIIWWDISVVQVRGVGGVHLSYASTSLILQQPDQTIVSIKIENSAYLIRNRPVLKLD